MLTNEQKEYLIELIKNDNPIPEDIKYHLFPILQEEYELTYAGKMRKEDLLADEDGTFPVPLQVERIFNNNEELNFNENWNNMIVFGDNLQFLKTINENKDPIIKDKVKGKVKLIYIDPPFATQDEFQNKEGAKAYNDKKQGAEFLEFLRRRLIIAREILADDGCMFVHVDDKMGHYVKVLLDEVFGKNNYRNELIWKYFGPTSTEKNFPRKHDTIYFYSKGKTHFFNSEATLVEYDEKAIKRYDKVDKDGKRYKLYNNSDGTVRKAYMKDGKPTEVFNIPFVQGTSSERIGYPTQKPEALLERIVRAVTEEGDLILDFFGGSGTTMAVAEKLGRRWITCDLGKLSYLTMQKRMLQIESSKDPLSGKIYGLKARPFMTCTLGLYDLRQTLTMDWEKYKSFVSQLFDFELTEVSLNGIKFDGEKRGFPVKIFNYMEYEDSGIDGYYLENLVENLGEKIPSRVYLVSPATKVNYIADYEEINDCKFYFLKVPYEMIEELHKKPFVKLRQPRSKNNINEIEEMKGFQFIYKPEIQCKLINKPNCVSLVVEKFYSNILQNEIETSNFEALSSIFVNYNFNGENFIMDDVRFWSDIESENSKDSDTKIFEMDNEIQSIEWEFPKGLLGENPMFVFSDIYGNDITVKLEVE